MNSFIASFHVVIHDARWIIDYAFAVTSALKVQNEYDLSCP